MSNKKTITIGTRKSELAQWQATTLAGQLQEAGYHTQLKLISSAGDRDRSTPLWEMGGKGVFTKALDEALLDGEINIAVHSYKDLPTENPLPLKVAAVLERGDPRDTLVARTDTDFLEDGTYEVVIATGSNRRKAQWLNRYPQHAITSLRGNVNTRLEKIEKNRWDGAIFAAAGLQRINLEQHISQYLDWMVPAPAQAAVAVMIREEDTAIEEAVATLNHRETELCTSVERNFLHEMEAGCSSPVGGWARIDRGKMHFTTVALTHDGAERFEAEETRPVSDIEYLGKEVAHQLLEQGADKVIEH